jgi:hypothetical protein
MDRGRQNRRDGCGKEHATGVCCHHIDKDSVISVPSCY